MSTFSFARKAACGLLAMGSSLVISACYGVVRIYEIASGRVNVPEGNPQQYGTQVCARLNADEYICQLVDSGGNYYLDSENEAFIDKARQQGFDLCAGDTAGLLVEDCVQVPPNSIPAHQDFTLEFSANK